MVEKIVAIDGPSASGKSTVARRVAAGLGYLYVDSGALYRGVTWKALKEGIVTTDTTRVASMLGRIDISFFVRDNAVRFRIDGCELADELRTSAVNENVSKIAAMPAVRTQVVSWLRDMSQFGNLVMEGRDIGTAVFPDAGSKFYLDASEEERAKRRFREIEKGASKVTVSEVGESLKRRDSIDRGRKMDPLRIANGAEVIDTTRLDIDEVTKLILDRLKSKP
jgi:cytidylate kinase